MMGGDDEDLGEFDDILGEDDLEDEMDLEDELESDFMIRDSDVQERTAERGAELSQPTILGSAVHLESGLSGTKFLRGSVVRIQEETFKGKPAHCIYFADGRKLVIGEP